MSWSAPIIAAEVILLFPLLAPAVAGDRFARAIGRLPAAARVALPALAAIPYCLVTHSAGDFRWSFAGLYVVLPVILVALLWNATKLDPQQSGNWRDFVVLAILGTVVEFRLFERAWPQYLGSFNRLILLDTGIYGFLTIRQLTNVGFNFVPRLQDLKTGLRELVFYAPIAIPLGLGLGFLHFHPHFPSLWKFALSWLSIFAFIAVLEETYFRGWVQNLLERRVGPRWSLLVTAVLFGLSHLNKGAAHFNWRYVLLATFAGIFYGRAWREGQSPGSVRYYPCISGHDMVALAAVNWLASRVAARMAPQLTGSHQFQQQRRPNARVFQGRCRGCLSRRTCSMACVPIEECLNRRVHPSGLCPILCPPPNPTRCYQVFTECLRPSVYAHLSTLSHTTAPLV